MKRSVTNAGILVATMVIGLAVNAGAGTRVRQVRHTQRVTPVTVAIAALFPIGETSGWGRIKVEDSANDTKSFEREVSVELFGLEPSAQYTISADDVGLGQVYTDAQGWATLKLRTPSTRYPPVPQELPAATDLQSATVTDSSGAFVLEGRFIRFGDGWSGRPKYVERIVLEDVNGSGVTGIAKVESDDDSRQVFLTCAAGLTPGSQYAIVVDGFQAGLVTADVVGQARLRLASDDDENPLPEELEPVEDIRQVEWRDGNDEVLLSGSFTGVPDNGDMRNITGQITELAANGFSFMTPDGILQVVVNDDTVFENFASLDDLAIGDIVKVEGSLDGSTITAARVKLMVHMGDDDREFMGEITAIASDGFTLQTPMGSYQVTVTPDTVFENFTNLDDLAVGDIVKVEGSLDGSTITAAKVELMVHMGDDDRQFIGEITAIASDGFTLQTPMGSYQVAVTSDTIFENFASLDDLAVGDIVRVEGSLDGSTITAAKIELMVHMGDDDRQFTGAITAIASDGFSIQTAMGSYQVAVTSDTVFENFSSLDDLAVGDIVKVEGSLDGSTITAAKIELMMHMGGDDSQEYSGKIVALRTDGFTLQVGMGTVEVIVDANTVFENFGSLADLQLRDKVEVEGIPQGSSVLAETIRKEQH